MPRSQRRAAPGLLIIAALLLVAVPADSKQGDLDPRPVLWRGEPVLHKVVKSCGGTSPVQNFCQEPIPSDACRLGCVANVLNGLAYTGTVTAIVWGEGSQGDLRHISYTCQYLAGSRTRVMGFGTSECWGGGNAEYFCLPECGDYLWPPLRLEGRSTPFQGLGPAGSWTVRVET